MYIVIEQTRSLIGQPKNVRRIMQTLGLRGIRKSHKLKDNNCARGMINKVRHLVNYRLEK